MDDAATGSFFGIDIIVDEALRPWLIEVNEGCAFGEYTTQAVADGAAGFSRDLAAALILLAEERQGGVDISDGGWQLLGVN